MIYRLLDSNKNIWRLSSLTGFSQSIDKVWFVYFEEKKESILFFQKLQKTIFISHLFDENPCGNVPRCTARVCLTSLYRFGYAEEQFCLVISVFVFEELIDASFRGYVTFWVHAFVNPNDHNSSSYTKFFLVSDLFHFLFNLRVSGLGLYSTTKAIFSQQAWTNVHAILNKFIRRIRCTKLPFDKTPKSLLIFSENCSWQTTLFHLQFNSLNDDGGS